MNRDMLPRLSSGEMLRHLAEFDRIGVKWAGTIVINEGDRAHSDETSDFAQIFNAGFEKGGESHAVHDYSGPYATDLP